MTPAAELLAAIKEHATADVSFEFRPAWPKLHVCGMVDVDVTVNGQTKMWCESVYGSYAPRGKYEHESASSAVHSAFLRARK